jgi:hypothetical protein
MNYGPAMLPPLALVGVISERFGVFVAVYALKSIWLLVHYVNCWLLYKIVEAKGKDPVQGVLVYALNPLVLLELLGNGHNDGMLILSILAALTMLHHGWSAVAMWLAFVASLTKAPGIILCAGVCIYLYRRGQWRQLCAGTAAIAATVLLLHWTLFPNLKSAFALVNLPRGVHNSFHALIYPAAEALARLDLPINPRRLYALDRQVFTVLFAAFAIWRLGRIRDWTTLLREISVVWLGLFVGYAAMFWPWYVTWLLPLAALTESRLLAHVIQTYSFSVLSLYAVPIYLVDQAPLRRMWATLRIVCAHGLPFGLVLAAQLRRQDKKLPAQRPR